MKKIFFKTAVRLFLLIILTVWIGIPGSTLAADTIKIGLVDAFSGPAKVSSGDVQSRIAQYVVDEQNAKGGLLGKKLEIVIGDGEFKPDVSTRKARQLIMKDKVSLIMTGVGTHIVGAVSKVCANYKTLFLNVGGVGNYLQGKDHFSRYSFRAYPNSYQITSAALYGLKATPYKKVYIIGIDYAFTHDIVDTFKRLNSEQPSDLEIVGEAFHPTATKDFGPYISKIQASGAEIVAVYSWGSDSLRFVQQFKSLGAKQDLLIGIEAAPSFTNALKEDAVGIYSSASSYGLDIDTPENKAFIAKWHEKFKGDEYRFWWPCSVIGCKLIGLQMMVAAIEKAGSLDPDKVIETLEGMWYKTPVGWASMRKCDHQLITPYALLRVEAGRNPYFNGSIDPKVNFPWFKLVRMLPAMELALPPTSDYNPRCP